MYSERLRKLSPYVPGEQPQNREYIKLNTNENPFPPAPGVQQFLKEFDADTLRLYPDPDSKKLCRAFADRFGIDREEVFVGNGSDEVLSHLFYAFFDTAFGPVLFPDVTYSFYPVFCSFHGLPYTSIPVNDDFEVDFSPYIELCGKTEYSGIIFANPNAPTGISHTQDDIRGLLDSLRNDRLVAVDEAYVDFGGESVMDLINTYPNLLVVGTLSKSYALAGLRLGYAAGQRHLIEALTRAKDSFNSYPVSRLAQEIGIRALGDRDYFTQSRDKLVSVREFTRKALTERGWQVLPSRANFLFARPPRYGAEELYELLKARGILVRFFSAHRTREFVRISVGTGSEMESLLSVLSDLGL